MKQLSSSRLDRLPTPRYRVALVGALLAVALVFGAFSFAPAAHAAPSTHLSSNARAAAVVPNSGAFAQIGAISYAWSVAMQGYNQSGTLINKKCLNITATPPNGNVLYNWWWNGYIGVNLTFYHSTKGYSSPYNCPDRDPSKVYQTVFFSGTNANIFFAQDLS